MIHFMKNYEDEKEEPAPQCKVPNPKFVSAVSKLKNRFQRFFKIVLLKQTQNRFQQFFEILL
jgi:hypothetical protein